MDLCPVDLYEDPDADLVVEPLVDLLVDSMYLVESLVDLHVDLVVESVDSTEIS